MLIGELGQAAVRALLFVVCAGIAVHAAAIASGRPLLRRASRWLMVCQFALAAAASAALLWLLVTENNWYAYVADYTGPGLALIYRIAAFWGGNAGSLLFWALVLTLYGAVVAFARHEDSERMLPIVSLILSCITGFYALVLNVLANPFVRLSAPMPPAGLNPLLQNPGMTVHPVNVYLGFVGFSIPFAYAMAGLLLKKTDSVWLTVTRRWTLVSWLFLSIGIVYGAHWSYEELGWGGYWAWDPVENASLLPWLTATAFLHSAVVQERKGMLKAWNVILITLTFLLTLLGTFLTRSGVLWSIHAFANAPLGVYFLSFFMLVLLFSAVVIALRFDVLRADRRFEAVVSKESAFLLNNVLFLGSAFAVLWGTVFPIISQTMTGRKMMVDSPFYNAVNLPLAVCIVVLMGVGPLIAWRRARLKNVWKVLVYPAVAAIGLGLLASGVLRYAYGRNSLLGTLGLISACFVVLTVFMEFYQAVEARSKFTGENRWYSLYALVRNNRRKYGGYVVHVAVALIAIGIAGSGAFHIQTQQALAAGDTAIIGDYRLTFAGMGVGDVAGGKQMYAHLIVQRGGHTLGEVRPSATFYDNGQAPSTNVALYSRPLEDLYVVMLGTVDGTKAVFDFHVNPLVQFIWYGGYLFIAGTLISLWPERVRSRRIAGAAEHPLDQAYQQLAELEYDYQMGKLDRVEYERSRNELEARINALGAVLQRLRERLQTELDAALQHAENGHGTGDGIR